MTILIVCEGFSPRHSYVEGPVCTKTKLATIALFICITGKEEIEDILCAGTVTPNIICNMCVIIYTHIYLYLMRI